MHDSKLRMQHLYSNSKPISRVSFDLQKPSIDKSSSKNFKIFTHNLNIEPDYDLPLKQLQYTKTRKYKQNLNPIFQQLQTTQDRYSYSKNFKNDNVEISDKSFLKQPKGEKKTKTTELKERSRVLSENVKKVQKSQLFSFGELIYPMESKPTKNTNAQLLSNNNRRIVPETDNAKTKHKEARTNKQFEDIFTFEQNIPYQNQQELTSSQLAEQYIQQIARKTQETIRLVTQSEQKLQLLRKQVEMHKQKNMIKERQLFFLQEQKQTLQNSSKELKQFLKLHSQTYIQIEAIQHQTSKKLRHKKQQLKKQQNWLKEENAQVSSIERRFQELLKLIREAEQEQEKRQMFWKQFQQQTEKNQQLKMYLQQADERIHSLQQQNRALQQETSTLQMHQQQLANLESKFSKQTQALVTTINQLNQQIIHKHQFIQQEEQIDELIRELELQVGQINQKIILSDQQIQDIHVKISLKKRNIKYIQNKQPERGQFVKKQPSIQYQKTLNNNDNDQQSYPKFTTLTKQTNKDKPNKPPLPTIRQQSKNTSAYQSPKLQEQQQSYHPFESNSLEIDSRMISQTQILRPHQQQSQKKKKYFVIQSEDDNMSNVKSSFNNNNMEKNSQQLFIERQKKPSIQQRLFQVEDLRMRTDNEHKNSFSVQLQTSRYNPDIRQQSLQSQTNIQKQPSKQKRQIKEQKSPKKKQQYKPIKKQNSPKSSNCQSEEVFQSLIEQYEHIKSNSCFQESWKRKI